MLTTPAGGDGEEEGAGHPGAELRGGRGHHTTGE